MTESSTESTDEMADPTEATAPLKSAPTGDSDRLVSVDALRGFALLGILVMNIQAFSMIAGAYVNPMALGEIKGPEFWAWFVTHLFADQKFMTIFSLLFGAGIIMMTEHQAAKSLPALALHYRRMIWLLIIGLMHAYLFWMGDILVSYAICGSVAYAFRKLPATFLAVLGIASLTVASLIFLGFGLSMEYWPEEQVEAMATEGWAPSAEQIEKERAIYRGSWLEQMPHRAFTSLMVETFLLIIQTGWRAGGLMLIGMALWKWRILQGQRSTLFYSGMILFGSLGIPIILYGVHRNFEEAWSITYSFFLGSQFNYWGSVLVSLAYIGGMMIACRIEQLKWVLRPLAAVGQMALTNYLMHTIICTTIFYGHGLGLFGTFSRVEQLLLVGAIWTLQLILSPIWLARFRFGPFEWLWRSLTYWRLQPMRRSVPA